MKCQQAWQQLEGSFGEGSEAILLKVEVSQLRESCGLNNALDLNCVLNSEYVKSFRITLQEKTFECIGAEGSEVIL